MSLPKAFHQQPNYLSIFSVVNNIIINVSADQMNKDLENKYINVRLSVADGFQFGHIQTGSGNWHLKEKWKFFPSPFLL